MPSTRVWLGGSASTPQVDTRTVGAPAVGSTYTVTINGKAVTYTAASTVAATEAAALVAALQASNEPEFQEVTWANPSGAAVTGTGPDNGTPFAAAYAAGGSGTPTFAGSTTTAPVSPNDWATAANWSGAAVPVTGDTVIFDATSAVDCLYGLNQSGVTLAALTVAAGYTGNLGLPARNEAGYAEYRTAYLSVGATAVTVGGGDGGGSGRVKLDAGAVQASVAVLSTGSNAGGEPGAFLFKGTHAVNAVNVGAGSVGIAALAGEVATVATLRVGAGSGLGAPTVTGGAGLTLATLVQDGGDVTLNAGPATATLIDGTLTVMAGNVTTANVDGGTLYYQGTGTVAALNVSAGGAADFTRDPRPRTVTNCTVQSGAKLTNTFMTATFTNAVVLNRCSLADVAIDFGTHLSLTVAPGP